MSLGPVKTTGGAAGEAISLQGENLEVVLDRAFAPGNPISLVLAEAEQELGLEGRAIGSKRQPDGRYLVRVRLVNLRREDRLRLEAASAR